MKKLVSFVMIFTLLLSIKAVFADENILNLSIEDVQQQAVLNNKQIGLDDLNINAMISALSKAKDNAAKLGDAFGYEAVLNNKIIKEVDTMEATSNVEVATRVKMADIIDQKLNAYKVAMNLIELNKELNYEKQELSILQEKQKIAQAKMKLGTITENDLIDIEYSIDSKQNDIENVQAQMKTASLELKNILNLTLDDSTVTIKDELIYQPLDTIDIDKFISDAKESSVGIYQAEEKVKAEEKRMELTALYYKLGDNTFDNNAFSLETAKLDLETAQTNLEVDIKNKYNNLLNQKDKVEIADKYLKLIDKKLANLEVKFKKGIINNETLLAGKETDITAVYQKYLEIYNYNIQKEEFLNLIDK